MAAHVACRPGAAALRASLDAWFLGHEARKAAEAKAQSARMAQAS